MNYTSDEKIQLIKQYCYMRISAYNDALDSLRMTCPKVLFNKTANGVYEVIGHWKDVLKIIEDKGV